MNFSHAITEIDIALSRGLKITLKKSDFSMENKDFNCFQNCFMIVSANSHTDRWTSMYVKVN